MDPPGSQQISSYTEDAQDKAIDEWQLASLLFGMEDVSPEKQSEYLSVLLTPLCQQVEMLLLNDKVHSLEESSAKVANIQQVIIAINALSRVFLWECRSGVLLDFSQQPPTQELIARDLHNNE